MYDIDFETGAVRWVTELHRAVPTESRHLKNSYASETPVTDGERFYVVTDNGVMYALDAKTGEVLLGPTRLPSGTYSASPVLAEGRLYIINEDGMASVVRLADDDLEILATNDMEAYTLSSMAMSNGQIFLRTAEALYCIGQ